VTAIHGMVGGFYPSSSVVINISSRTVFKVAVGGTAVATYTIDNDGTVKNHVPTTLETWLGGTGGVASNYEVRATLTSGTAPSSGTLNSWLNCGTDRSWSNSNSARDGSTVSSTITVEIREAATGVVKDSASIVINAISESGF
jgi:hypothetical protein